MSDDKSLNVVELATELTIAWLGNQNNRVQADDVPTFLRTMHATINDLSAPQAGSDAERDTAEAPDYAPAVSVRKSLASRDKIISLIDGKPYTSLTRHLTKHGLTPKQYRDRYNLKPDYPMVAPSYSEHRRSLAQKIGLGRKAHAAADALGNVAETVSDAAAEVVQAVGETKPVRRARKVVTGEAAAPKRARKPKTPAEA